MTDAIHELQQEDYPVLVQAVNLARAHQIQKVAQLRTRLLALGNDAQSVNRALKFWAKSLVRTRAT